MLDTEFVSTFLIAFCLRFFVDAFCFTIFEFFISLISRFQILVDKSVGGTSTLYRKRENKDKLEAKEVT